MKILANLIKRIYNMNFEHNRVFDRTNFTPHGAIELCFERLLLFHRIKVTPRRDEK